jgi:hypothetical protein
MEQTSMTGIGGAGIAVAVPFAALCKHTIPAANSGNLFFRQD